MKKPEEIVMYLTPEREDDDKFLDWNGKECSHYKVHLPFWLVRAYNLDKHVCSVKITVTSKSKPMSKRSEEEAEAREYFKKNWAKKARMRKRIRGIV